MCNKYLKIKKKNLFNSSKSAKNSRYTKKLAGDEIFQQWKQMMNVT